MNSQAFHYNNYGFPLQFYNNPPEYPYPLHSHSINYSYRQLEQKYQELRLEHQRLLLKHHELQEVLENLPQRVVRKRKIKRRAHSELDKCHRCPYGECKKQYASEFALNLHIRGKHHGGNKKQRDRAAVLMLQQQKIIIKCQDEGIQPPPQGINLPPGYIEQNRVRIMLMDSAELSPVQLKEEQ